MPYAMLQSMSFVSFRVKFQGVDVQNPKLFAILNGFTVFSWNIIFLPCFAIVLRYDATTEQAP